MTFASLLCEVEFGQQPLETDLGEREKRETVINSFVKSGSPESSVPGDKTSPSLPLACEEIVNLYLKDVDRSLIRENLLLSYTDRLRRLQRNVQAANAIRGAGVRAVKSQR